MRGTLEKLNKAWTSQRFSATIECLSGERAAMAIMLEAIRALENDSYEITISDAEGMKTFVFLHNKKRQSVRPDKAFMTYSWGRLSSRGLIVTIGQFISGQSVEFPMKLEETSFKEF
jgi:hypothetical protein